ncbi:MAG TPA: diacylglycerol kinase, partial [Methyloversatilis sp.]
VEGLQQLADGCYRNALSPAQRQRGRRRWTLRRLQGRVLQVARLMKSVLTFENGIDYLAWKLERHTGHPVEVTPRLRRHPLIFGWPLLWRLLRQKRLR